MLSFGRRMKNKKSKPNYLVADLAVLALAPIAASLLAWFLPLDFIAATLLIFGAPAAYLSLRNPASIRRVLIFSAVFAGVGIVFFDYFGPKDGSWLVPTIFSFKVFGVIPLEDFLWAFLLVYFVLMFYENFFDHARHSPVGRNMHYLIPVSIAALAIFSALVLFVSANMSIPYFYFFGILVFMFLPVLAFVLEFPRFLRRLYITAAYFFAVGIMHELVALYKGYWSFPGHHFIGWVSLAGYRFPLEEFFFWLFLLSASAVAYFEFFDDNRLKLPRQAWLHKSSK